MKTCRVCGELKPLGNFYRSAGMADGYRWDCKRCNLAAKKARTALNPQANRDRVRKWQLENPERYKAKQREYVESGQKKFWSRRYHLKRKYGMTLEDYERMLVAQGGVCAICGEARPEERTLHVDHDHETGVIRGLLCFRCNQAIGSLQEDHDIFRAAADYLDRDVELEHLVRARVGALTG